MRGHPRRGDTIRGRLELVLVALLALAIFEAEAEDDVTFTIRESVEAHGADYGNPDASDVASLRRRLGNTTNTTNATAPTTAVAAAAGVTVTCTDTPVGWTSSNGANCASYVANLACTPTGGYGTGWNVTKLGPFTQWAENGTGITATTACCGCGGGKKTSSADAVTPVVTTPLIVVPAVTNVTNATAATCGWSWKQIDDWCHPWKWVFLGVVGVLLLVLLIVLIIGIARNCQHRGNNQYSGYDGQTMRSLGSQYPQEMMPMNGNGYGQMQMMPMNQGYGQDQYQPSCVTPPPMATQQGYGGALHPGAQGYYQPGYPNAQASYTQVPGMRY